MDSKTKHVKGELFPVSRQVHLAIFSSRISNSAFGVCMLLKQLQSAPMLPVPHVRSFRFMNLAW